MIFSSGRRNASCWCPAFLASTVAWLSLWDDEARELATVTCPEHLIDEGDPNGLPEPARVKILRSYAKGYENRKALFHSFDRAGLGRFGSAALTLAPDLATHWYVGGPQLKPDLVDLYDLRSKCVHGKIPFEQMQAQGVAGADQAGRLEYLAHELARRSIVAGMSAVERGSVSLTDRSTLESDWAAGRFP